MPRLIILLHINLPIANYFWNVHNCIIYLNYAKKKVFVEGKAKIECNVTLKANLRLIVAFI